MMKVKNFCRLLSIFTRFVRISYCENKKLEDMKRVILWLCLSVVIGAVQAQTGRLDLKLPQGHPRYLTTQEGKKETQELIKKAPWAKDVYERLRQRTDKYVDRGTDWLSSRLLMYWNTHATDVYIKGEYYAHAGGEKAPAPTVVFTGARSHATNYKTSSAGGLGALSGRCQRNVLGQQYPGG